MYNFYDMFFMGFVTPLKSNKEIEIVHFFVSEQT